jgi:hypothetical protein
MLQFKNTIGIYKKIVRQKKRRLSDHCFLRTRSAYGPITPNLATEAQTIILSQCSGCSCTCRGLIVDQ